MDPILIGLCEENYCDEDWITLLNKRRICDNGIHLIGKIRKQGWLPKVNQVNFDQRTLLPVNFITKSLGCCASFFRSHTAFIEATPFVLDDLLNFPLFNRASIHRPLRLVIYRHSTTDIDVYSSRGVSIELSELSHLPVILSSFLFPRDASISFRIK